jgi:hypothetical protein
MPYTDADALFRDRRRAEGGEGDVDDGGDDEHFDGRVRGSRRADTGDGRRRNSQRDGATKTRKRRADRIPPRGQRRRASWRRGCVPPAADRGGRGRRRRRWRRRTRPKLSLSHAKLSRETNNMKPSLLLSSKVSQIASAKLKSSKSAVLDMIKDPLLRNVNVDNAQELKMDTMAVIAATSTTGSTSSMLNRTLGKNMAIKTRQRVEVPPNV